MDKLAATFIKELKLLFRDRAGLLLLFAMPAALVIVITLIQANVMKPVGETGIRILVADLDGDTAGRWVSDGLARARGFTVDRDLDGRMPDEAGCRRAVTTGRYQFCIIVPPGTTRHLGIAATTSIKHAKENASSPEPSPDALPELTVYADPTVRGGFRIAVISAVRQVSRSLGMSARMAAMSDTMARRIDTALRPVVGSLAEEIAADIRKTMTAPLPDQPLVGVKLQAAGRGRFDTLPTAVQHNVPAWALFGMFFIVVPLAGSLIRERDSGTFSRILTMPVSPLVLIVGKMAAYILVCMTQFAFVVVIGKTVLPFLGTDVLQMGPSIGAVIGVAICSALAATAYGVMLGTVARSYEQASTVGPISIVMAAALGGIMVPVFAMPSVMRTISSFSPLAWSHGAFLELFIRGGSLIDVWDRLVWLLLFFCINLCVAWAMFRHRGR